MGAWGFLKKAGKKVGKFGLEALGVPVSMGQNIGKMIRGDVRGGLSGIGGDVKRAAQVAALVSTGGLAAPAMFAAGGGMLQRGMGEGASFRNVLGAGARGASGAVAARGVQNIGRSMLNRGAQTAVGRVAEQGAGRTAERFMGEGVANMSRVGAGEMLPAGLVAPPAPGSGPWGGIGSALKAVPEWLGEHPEAMTAAGQILSSNAEMGIREDQQQFYQDQLALRREQDEYEKSQEKMLRDMIISGAWRTRR